MTPKTYNMGLVLLPTYQWVDASGPVDYLNSHSQSYLSMLPLPQSIMDRVPFMHWHCISSDLTPMRGRSGPVQIPTCTYEDCPPLDYIVVPGPNPNQSTPAIFAKFIKERLDDPTLKGILLVETAAIALARTGNGVLDGKQVCGNKNTIRRLAEDGLLKGNKVNWVVDKRWVVDGKIWSASGVMGGIDLAAELAKVLLDEDIVKLVKDVTEYDENPAAPDPFATILEGIKLN